MTEEKLYIDQRHLSMVMAIIEPYDYSFFAFGSRVTGKNKKLSDLDLFYLDEIPNKVILELEEAFEESDIPFKIDLVNFKKCDTDFQDLILRDYMCIKESEKDRGKFI